MKKMEYKGRQWHEDCFTCCTCKANIGSNSFIPSGSDIFCNSCYEEAYAAKCAGCSKAVTSGGLTYHNQPWHKECFSCSNCSQALVGHSFTSRHDKPYCADCAQHLFSKQCSGCSQSITGKFIKKHAVIVYFCAQELAAQGLFHLKVGTGTAPASPALHAPPAWWAMAL